MSAPSIPAATPEPPYYAVIFTSVRTDDDDGYADTARVMAERAALQPGYLGAESARSDGLGLTVSYWRDLDSIAAWKADVQHQLAQALGRERWYERYVTRIARVERAYGFSAA